MKTAIIVCGSPGAGKSTHAARLAAERHAALLDIDSVTERLVRIALEQSGHSPDDRDSSHFKQTFRMPVYDTLFDIARENLPFLDVVIVGPFTREIRDSSWPAKLHELLDAKVEVHYVQCDPEIRRQRLAHRDNPRDRAKLDDWDNYIRYYGNEDRPVFAHVLIDGTGTTGHR